MIHLLISFQNRSIKRALYFEFQYLRGEDWYSLEATRAVNQAIGRVIRHRNDYGAIFLLDSRFSNPRVINQMSKWLRNQIKVSNNFGELMKDIRLFFKNAESKVCTIIINNYY